MTAGGRQRLGHLVEELIEHEQDVVGHAGFAQRRRVAQIDEHHGDLAFAALAAGADQAVRRAGVGREQRHHRNVAVGRIWQASRTPSVAPIRVSAAASSPAGSGSAARPSTTRMRQVVQRARPPQTAAQRDAVRAQRLEHGRAGQDRHGPSVGIGQPRLPPDALDDAAHGPRRERQQHQSGVDREGDVDGVPGLGDRGRRPVGLLDSVRTKSGILSVAHDLVAAGNVARQRQRRDQDGDCREHRQPRRIPSFGAQPEMQTDTGMNPHGQDCSDVQIDEPRHAEQNRRSEPVRAKHGFIGALGAVETRRRSWCRRHA